MFGNLFNLQIIQGGSTSLPSDSVSTEGLEETLADGASSDLLIIDLIIDSWPIMLPLFVLSIIAVYIWAERYSAIQKASKIDSSFMASLKNSVSQGKLDEAKQLCAASNTPVGRMLHKGISRLGRPLRDISTSIENVSNLEISNMEKNLSILATISGAAPMIGFLGTVIGMIVAFHEMASAGGNIDVEMLSKGIYTAMTTTVAGLIVGIIAFIAYNYLVSKVDKVVFMLEAKTTEFLDLLHHNE